MDDYLKLPPWEDKNEYNEWPGGFCCQRSAGGMGGSKCYEHNKRNYPLLTRIKWWLIRLWNSA